MNHQYQNIISLLNTVLALVTVLIFLAVAKLAISITNRLKLKSMSDILGDLLTEVQATKDVEESALVFIAGIEAKLNAAGTDEQKLSELKTTLATERQKLAAAIATPPADSGDASGGTSSGDSSSGGSASGGTSSGDAGSGGGTQGGDTPSTGG